MKLQEYENKRINCNNEDEVTRKIIDWLSDFNCFCYSNKFISDTIKLFHSNSNFKFDLFVLTQKGNIGIEIKNAQSSSNLYNAIFQLIDYARAYELKKLKIFINDIKFNIDYFVIASQYSLIGRLFKQESVEFIVDGKDNKKEQQKYNAYKKSEIPIAEFNRTKMLTRILWRASRRENVSIPVGVLINNIFTNTPTPHIFIKKEKERSRFMSIC